MGARMRLRRSDGRVFLERWGWKHDRLGGIFLHHMTAPAPGLDLHDHPWTFITIPLWGGYTEERALCREAPTLALVAQAAGGPCARGVVEERLPRRPRMMRLDECHRITHLRRRSAWTIVLLGPRRRPWGFYTPEGYIGEKRYDATRRRDLADDLDPAEAPA